MTFSNEPAGECFLCGRTIRSSDPHGENFYKEGNKKTVAHTICGWNWGWKQVINALWVALQAKRLAEAAR